MSKATGSQLLNPVSISIGTAQSRNSMEEILTSPITWIVVAAASEIIALSPKLKSNSVVQLIFSVLRALKVKKG